MPSSTLSTVQIKKCNQATGIFKNHDISKKGRFHCRFTYTVRESNPGLARGRGVFYH